MNVGLLVAAVAVLVAALVYFAQRQATARERQQDAERTARERQEDANKTARERRQDKINQSVRTYVDSALRISGIPGALHADVAELPDSEAVAEFLDRCAAAGETCLGSTYRSELENSELLVFFRRCGAQQNTLSNDAVVRAIIAGIREERHT
jgi:mannitol-specific phosphotransferase system IIBC component